MLDGQRASFTLKKTMRWAIHAAFAAFLLTGCDRKQPKITRTAYASMLKHGCATLPPARQFENVWGKSNTWHNLANFREDRTADWICRALVHDRYVLVLRFPVKVDPEGGRIVGPGGPVSVVVNQLNKVEVSPSGSAGAYFDAEWRLSGEQWSVLVQSCGDWATVGIPIRTNAPVPKAWEYWRSVQSQ